MSVCRTHKKKRDFSVLANEGSNDYSLSYKARGILWHLLTKPDGWEVRMSELENNSESDGRESVRSGFRELIERGYAHRMRVNNPETGKVEWVTDVFETRADLSEWLRERGITPSTGLPCMAQPSTANPSPYINTDLVNTDQTNPPNPQQAGGTTGEAATPSGGKKAGRGKRRTPPSISRYHPEEALALWTDDWSPMYKAFRGEPDDRKLFMEGFDILIEQGAPLSEILQGTKYYCETKMKFITAGNPDGTKIPPDGIRFFRGKNGGESYCLRAYAMWQERQGTKEQAQEDELALARQIGKHQTRLGIVGQPPKEWRDKTGCKTVGDMSVVQKREYLDWLISRSENDGSDTASPMSGAHSSETLARVA